MVAAIDLADWARLALAVAVLFGIVVLPGVVLARLAHLPTADAWLVGAPAGASVLMVAATIARFASIEWTPIKGMLAGGAVWAVAAALLWVVGGRRQLAPEERVEHSSSAEGLLLGLSSAALLALVVIVSAMRDPGVLPQTPDTNFHLFATKWMSDAGTASVLDATGVRLDPENYYPGGFFSLSATVGGWLGVPPTIAAHSVVLLCLMWLWPTSCTALARAVLGPSAAVSALAAPVALVFMAFPWRMLSWGALWPVLLATSMLPALLAVLWKLWEPSEPRPTLRTTLVQLAFASLLLVSMVLAHTSALFSAVLFVFFLGFAALVGRRQGTARVLLTVAAAVVLIGAVWLSGVVRPQGMYQRVDDALPWSDAVLTALTFGASPRVALLAFPVVALGAVVLTRRRGGWWVPGLLAGLLATYVCMIVAPGAMSLRLTWPWFHDLFRIIGLAVIPGVLCFLAGLLELGRHLRALWIPVAGITVVLLLLPVVAVILDEFRSVRSVYDASPDRQWISARQLTELSKLAKSVPDGSAVIGNPWTGYQYIYLATGIPAVIPTEKNLHVPGLELLGERLTDIEESAEVCGAAHRLHVDYVITGGPVVYAAEPADLTPYVGIDAVADDSRFPVVARAGDLALHEVPACSQ
ncbi:DUF6541 family protein [Nocardioides bigeumensis]|uniref:Glycosyltransferase RgtA/B/C/D-like domain-containing protein n=1 Tax=Nocardioides bigeumensis TaxID=433657 RepID=A0ABN2XTC3_9ACTN